MNKQDAIEEIGRLADSIQNINAASGIPGAPDRARMQALAEAMPDWVARARKAYAVLSGDDPWSDHPGAGGE